MRLMLRLSTSVAVALAACLTIGSAAVAAPLLPEQDPFYVAGGSLSAVAPGTVLRTRQVAFAEVGITTPMMVTQVLYRTSGELQQPSATVATIFRPASTSSPTKIVSYQTAYDGMSGICRPSYTLQGGNVSLTPALEENFILAYVTAGFTVVTSDYEGEDDEFGAGQEAGYGTLDAIRATENLLKLPATTPVGLLGYSGGATASDYAAELAPRYAPELNIVGVAEGGVPVDFAHSLTYVSGSSYWSGVMAPILTGLARGLHVDLTPYLSAKGEQVVKATSTGCLGSFLGAYPGLTIQQLLKPQYADWQAVPAIAGLFNPLIMSRSGTPREPMFIANGDSDGFGDGVMIVKDVDALAHTYCQRGLSVELSIYTGLSHNYAVVPFEAAALSFLEQRFAGESVRDDCATIPAGNSLAPLPVPAASAAPVRMTVAYRGVSRHPRGVVVSLATTAGTVRGVRVQLLRSGRLLATARAAVVTPTRRRVLLRLGRHRLTGGRYAVVVRHGGTVLLRRSFTVRALR
jgi:hypothetical protein